MKKISSLFCVGLCLFTLGLGVYVPAASAQSKPSPSGSGQALEIAPPVMTLSGDPGQVIKTQISLRDVSSGKLLVSGEVNDFVAAGEDGVPKILLEDDTDNPYSLKDWISPLPDILLVPREIKNLPVTIRIPADAAPGGYYGIIRFTAAAPELKGTGVSLSASLGSLILVTVKGDAKEGLAVEEFSVTQNGKKATVFQSTPIEFVERLKNTGNIHEQPVGQVVITDMFGKKVAAVNVNLPPRNILPSSIRKFTQPLDSTVIGDKKLFGRYKATLSVTYGADKQVLTDTITFWVIPYRLIGAVIVLLVGGFFVLRFVIRRYNRSIIKKAQKAQGTHKPKKQ
jgi:hypothetical protein